MKEGPPPPMCDGTHREAAAAGDEDPLQFTGTPTHIYIYVYIHTIDAQMDVALHAPTFVVPSLL